MAQLFIGLSGYDYKDWKGEGLFYPADLPGTKFLDFYASRYNSLEFHGAFKQMLSETSVRNWLTRTPDGFRVAAKMNQVVTHFKRLKPESLETVQLFLERLKPAEDGGKLGTVYLQLPPTLKRDDALLSSFLASVPRRPSLRWSIELPHESWHVAEVEALLREYGVAWVTTELDNAETVIHDTAEHVYLRLRKLEYSEADLKRWAEYLRGQIAAGRDCYVYCRHLDTVAPWKWADRIQELV